MAPSPERPRDVAESPPAQVDFWHLLEKEVERSRRYYRSFGLVRLDAAGDGSRRAIPLEWARRVTALLRRADVVTPTPTGVLYILLPETPPSTLPLIARRIRDALGPISGTSPQIRQAAFPRDGDSAPELLGALVEAPA